MVVVGIVVVDQKREGDPRIRHSVNKHIIGARTLHRDRDHPLTLSHLSLLATMEESISLEETNKIRISLGLKPLTEDGPPTDNKEKQAEDNYARRREEETKAKESKYVQRIADCQSGLTPYLLNFLQEDQRPHSQVSTLSFPVFTAASQPFLSPKRVSAQISDAMLFSVITG